MLNHRAYFVQCTAADDHTARAGNIHRHVCRIDWRHFDAGVMKVLQQLASTAEIEAVSELRQVEVTELSTVKNMPAYLNKCFNNRLWKARES
jgi:hypothetical protein